eukprot:1917286-Rhodomonas_salina.5
MAEGKGMKARNASRTDIAEAEGTRWRHVDANAAPSLTTGPVMCMDGAVSPPGRVCKEEEGGRVWKGESGNQFHTS